jgi:hypothetical protein
MVFCPDYWGLPQHWFDTAVAEDNEIIVELIAVVGFPLAQSDIGQQ